jgi:hypothetical protein
MANPRAITLDEGIRTYNVSKPYDNSTITYSATEANGSASVGLAVTLTTDDEVALVADGEYVFGKLLKVEADGVCVIERGYGVVLPGGTSATLTRGKAIVGDLLVSAEGYIREVATATAAELGVMGGSSIIDPSTATAVVVNLP